MHHFRCIDGMSVPLEHVHFLAKCIALSLGTLSTLVTRSRSTLWRGGIVGNNINSESQGSRFNPYQTLAQLMSRDAAKQACPEM